MSFNVRNSLFFQPEEHKLLQLFDDYAYGLPNDSFCNKNGQPCVDSLELAMGLNRHMRRRIAKIPNTSFIESYASAQKRLVLYVNKTSSAITKGIDILLTGDISVSWEAQIFTRFINRFHLPDGACQERFNSINDVDRDLLKKMFIDRYNKLVHLERDKKAKKHESSSTKYPTQNEVEKVFEVSAGLFSILLQRLDSWHQIDESEKLLLADVAFGCFTLFGREAMGSCLEKVPSLVEYYKFVTNKKAAYIDSADKKLVHSHNPMHEKYSLLDLYTDLFDIAERATHDTGNISYAEKVDELIRVHLPAIRESYTFGENAIQKILMECIFALEDIAKNIPLSYFEDEEFLYAFRSAWLSFFNDRFRNTVPIDFLKSTTRECRTTAKDIRDRFSNAQLSVETATQKLQVLQERLSGANFREKAEIRAEITSTEEQRTKGKKEQSDAENDGYLLMMPLGKSLDELPDGNDVRLEVDQFHPTARDAIKNWCLDDETAYIGISGNEEEVQASDTLKKHSDLDIEIIAPVPEFIGIAATADLDPAISSPSCPQAPTAKCNIAKAEYVPEALNVANGQIENFGDPHSSLPQLELDVSHYIDDMSAACERLRQCQKNIGIVPAIAIDNIALHWLRLGHLHLAYKTLEVAPRLTIQDDLFPTPLLQAAYQGMHVWRCDHTTVSRILLSMNQLSQHEVDLWLERKPGNRLVPYLVFSATFQATIFAGNMTNAPRLLASVSTYFDGPVLRLIDELVQFADHNNRCDIDVLRELPKTDDKANRKKIAERLLEWRDRVINKQTGWAPARKAMKECLNLPDFAKIIHAIERDDASANKIVKEFADYYRDTEQQQRLMQTEILKIMNESASAPQIEGNARNWFLRTIDEVVALSDEWLEEHTQQGLRGSEASKFSRRFVTMAGTALTHMQKRIARTDDIELSAGLRIACDALEAVCKVADRNFSVIWDSRRVAGWMAWPGEWLSSSLDSDDAPNQVEFLMEHLVDGLDFVALTNTALAQKNFRHATLLLLYRRDVLGESIGDALQLIDLQFAEKRRVCHQRSDRLRSMLDNANVASLIDDERHCQLAAEVDHLQEQIKNLDGLDLLDEIQESLTILETDIGDKFNAKITDLQKEMESLVRRSRVEQGVDSVPSGWIEHVNTALAQRETTVAEEMLDHLKTSLDKGTPLSMATISSEGFLKRFLDAEPRLYQVIYKHPNPREVIRNLLSTDNLGLDFTAMPSSFKRGIENAMILPTRFKSLDKELYEGLVNILYILGLDVVTLSYTGQTENKVGFKIHGKFCRLTIQVKRRESPRGFVFFDSEAEEQSLTILLVGSDWTVQELRTLLNEHLTTLHDRTILISGKPLTNDVRNDFASFCKREKHTLYHADPVLMSILAGLATNEHTPFKTFLQLSLPWTYSNPYTGNQMRSAPPEMRYGRQNDLKLLTTMRNGAAIIFGGRQLGKTTLLNESHRLFNNPTQKQHAFLHQMDGNLDRANLSGDELEKYRTQVWSRIFNDAVETGLIKKMPGLDTESTEGKVNSIHEYFRRPNAEAMLVCFDEIDRILGLDAANGFRIFRELSSLVNTSNGRFKVIIAGLENVRRFADAPNYPLHQLGSAIQVSIMSPNEALQLIKEPLGYLGYEFENALLVNRILVETNRHPGLIHIFCHELIKHMSSRHQGRVGSVRISADDIEKIRRDPEVRELICDRFDITLNLDLRYKLIAYSLILQGTNTFSASRAKTIVEEWAPDIFRPMTEGQFEAFLDELCGLGVLHNMRHIEVGKEYALRNANILNLVGGKNKIEDKLLGAVESITDDDPLSGHAFPEKAKRPSPLILRDEKQLISEETWENPSTSKVTAMSSSYSVGIIVGSEALGLNLQWIIDTLPAIGEEEPPLHLVSPIRYSTLHKADTDSNNQAEFRKLLNEVILGSHSMKVPMMFLVDIKGEMPISHTLDLIDIAHEARLNTNLKRHRVRVIFLLHPKAFWLWESNPLLTKGRETMQPFIALDRWTRTAMAHLLNRMGLENTSAAVNTLEEYSQGWYLSMDYLLAAHQKKPEVYRLTGFGKNYVPLVQANAKALSEFLGKTGLLSVEWALPVLRALIDEERFDEDDIALQFMELQLGIEAKQALSWLVQLRIIEPVNTRPRQSVYRLTDSVALAIKARVSQEVKA